MAWGAAVRIELTEAERAELKARSRRRKIARADAMRAEIILCAADGMTNVAIAEEVGVTRLTVSTWRNRFAERRLASPTSPDRGRHERSATKKSPMW